MTYLRRNGIGSPANVRRGEAEHVKAGADQAILAAVVINQPITVIAPVVFDCQALEAIEQVWTAQETALIVVDGNLSLRPREASKQEEHS